MVSEALGVSSALVEVIDEPSSLKVKAESESESPGKRKVICMNGNQVQLPFKGFKTENEVISAAAEFMLGE